MNYKEKIESAISYVVNDNYSIHDRAIKISKRIHDAKNICIFGVGEFFDDCAHLINRYNYISDNDQEKWGKQFNGRLCVSPKQLSEIEDLVVVIMVGEYRSIATQLENLRVEYYPCDYLFLNVYDYHYENQWFINNKENMIKVLDLFADEQSKEVYVEALINRIAPPLATKIFNELKIPGEYYEHGLFELSEEEYMVDAGAYIGDSLEEFVKSVHGEFKKVYSFELNSTIFEKLKEKVQILNLPTNRIELFNAGVFNENKEVTYYGDADSTFGSFILQGTANKARVVKLDDALAGKKVTLIKMDVEGSELAALEGAKVIIMTQRPKLAISVYHFLSDLWEVPMYIKNLNNQYKIYMRHHSPVVWDTDCYAI